jgi:hypothetical protein
MLGEFSLKLENGGLSNINAETGVKMGIDSCFGIHVYASVVEIKPNDDIESIIQGARPGSRIVARHICG